MQKYRKKLEKNDSVNLELKYPEFFLHTGNYALNKLMTGDFSGGIPQGRLVCFVGHSSSGKSLVAASAVAAILRNGGLGFVLDSETSLDEKFLQNCGVDTDSERFQYIGVDGIPQTTSIVNDILKTYRETGETTPAVIVVDSLDMLLTETEQNKLNTKGEIGGDQGQQAKQLKATLKTWVHSLTGIPVAIICTKQPYQEQDPIKAYEEPWKFTESLKFAFSQIIMFEKLQFKEKVAGKSVHKGFTLKARSYKNRFAREKQVVKIEIPFDNGVDEFSGLIEIAEEFGIIEKNGGWFTPVAFDGKKFQQKAAEADLDFMNMLLEQIKAVNNPDMEVNASLDEYVSESEKDDKLSRRKRVNTRKETESETDDD